MSDVSKFNIFGQIINVKDTIAREGVAEVSGNLNELRDSLKEVAFSGDYNDLSNKPSIPTLAPVATSGNYNDLTNKPNLAPVATSGKYNDLTNKPNLAPVATSGSYNDLTNKPDLRNLTELVWIGDSFSTGFQPNTSPLTNPIPKIVAEMTGLNLHNYGVNASGFTIGGDGGKTFLDEANTAIADTSFDHSKVKYVVVLGGINDVNNNPSGNMYNASVQLFRALGNEFHSAVLFYIPNWGGVSLPDFQEKIFASAGAIHDGDIGSNGFVYARNNLTALMGRIDLINNDNIHPNQAGAYHMAGVIYQLLNGSETNAGRVIPLISNNDWNISGLNMYKTSDMIRIFGNAIAVNRITTSNLTICGIPTEGTFAGTFYQICPSKVGSATCTVEISPSVALTSAPSIGTIKMFHDHGSTIEAGDNVLINILIPLLNM